jgi:hypothetical protein
LLKSLKEWLWAGLGAIALILLAMEDRKNKRR